MELEALTNLVDEFGVVRDTRLAADKAAAKLKEQEGLLKEQIIKALQEVDGGGVTGSMTGVKLQRKTKPVASDWTKVHAYILETGSLDLLHRRLTEEAVKARWDDQIIIPGVEPFIVFDLTVSKR